MSTMYEQCKSYQHYNFNDDINVTATKTNKDPQALKLFVK